MLRDGGYVVVEDGPTLTHGEMTYGAAVLAAKQHGAAELVDPRPFAVGSIAKTFEDYPNVGTLLRRCGADRRNIFGRDSQHPHLGREVGGMAAIRATCSFGGAQGAVGMGERRPGERTRAHRHTGRDRKLPLHR